MGGADWTGIVSDCHYSSVAILFGEDFAELHDFGMKCFGIPFLRSPPISKHFPGKSAGCGRFFHIPDLYTFADTHVDKPTVILKKQCDFQHISLCRCQNIILKALEKCSGIAHLIDGEFLLPFDNGDLSPGFGYFTFGKFGLGGVFYSPFLRPANVFS